MAEEEVKTQEVQSGPEKLPETSPRADHANDNPQKEEEKKEEEVIEEDPTTLHERAIATLSYMGPLAIIPFYLKKDSKFCRFHGKQGLLLAVIYFLAMSSWVLNILMDITIVFQVFIFFYMGIFGSLSGRWKKMPWIYEKSCLFEKTLSLESEGEEDAMGPDEVKKEDEPKK